MKLNTKLAIALVATATSVFGLASGAMAGEGGAAGAAAFTISGTAVTGVAVAAAVGKNDAAAAAFQGATAVPNAAYALGSGGLITLDQIGTPASASITGTASTNSTSEANTLTADVGTIKIGAADDTEVVTIP
ncbi:hypothetical protein [uncultured Nostoc sp.]|uniref:hypothetical protein n=1 Tax=uncultured Nostoc sp. TaxID=340711 RepID=UPI0035CC5210